MQTDGWYERCLCGQRMLCDGETENHCTECAQVLCGDDDCETERDDGIVMCDECAAKYMVERAIYRTNDLLMSVSEHAAEWTPDAHDVVSMVYFEVQYPVQYPGLTA